MFDSSRYTDAAHCYTLWACALTRHAFIGLYGDRRYEETAPLVELARDVARRGDTQLSTRHWVAAVQAEVFAAIGDLDSCKRALDEAEEVHSLSGPVHNGGWLRFDGARLAEERGTCFTELQRPDLAENALITALRILPPGSRGNADPAGTVASRARTAEVRPKSKKPGRADFCAEHLGMRGSSVDIEDGRIFREAWIAGVRKHFPGEPKPGYITPWEETPAWERESAAAVCRQVREFIRVSGGGTTRLSREQRGRFVATCWIAQIYHRIEDPKPGYVADWPELPAWQQETDADIFDAIERATTP